MKQTRDFLRDEGKCHRDFLSKQINLENQRDSLVADVTTEVWRRDEQEHDLRAKLSLHALHSGDVTPQQSQECGGLHSALDRIGTRNISISRDA